MASISRTSATYAASNYRAAAAYYRDSLKFGPAPSQCPADMLTDLKRAEARARELQADFAQYIDRHANVRSDEGATRRMSEAVELLSGRKRICYPQPRHLMFPGLTHH